MPGEGALGLTCTLQGIHVQQLCAFISIGTIRGRREVNVYEMVGVDSTWSRQWHRRCCFEQLVDIIDGRQEAVVHLQRFIVDLTMLHAKLCSQVSGCEWSTT